MNKVALAITFFAAGAACGVGGTLLVSRVLPAQTTAATVPPPEPEYQRIVKLHLNDPDSAIFRDASQSKRDSRVWCGELNAKNRMGGMVGYSKFVAELPPKANAALSRDEERQRSFVVMESNDGFVGRWKIYCTD